jgi:Cu-Zn family superoxide dismutase
MGVEETDMNLVRRTAVPLAAAGLILAGCTSQPRESASPGASPSQPPTAATPAAAAPAVRDAGGVSAARAELNPTQGSQASGLVRFAPAEGGLLVTADLTDLTPGQHGFHLHETPDCSALDGSSAGEHWNPTLQPHGPPDGPARHSGDLGNVTANASGAAQYRQVLKGLSLEGSQGVIGRAVIVHAQADDFASQPAGNSGGRVACGVVEAARPRDPG